MAQNLIVVADLLTDEDIIVLKIIKLYLDDLRNKNAALVL